MHINSFTLMSLAHKIENRLSKLSSSTTVSTKLPMICSGGSARRSASFVLPMLQAVNVTGQHLHGSSPTDQEHKEAHPDSWQHAFKQPLRLPATQLSRHCCRKVWTTAPLCTTYRSPPRRGCWSKSPGRAACCHAAGSCPSRACSVRELFRQSTRACAARSYVYRAVFSCFGSMRNNGTHT